MTKLNMKVRGVKIPVHLEDDGPSAGQWSASVEGETYTSESWAGLRSQLEQATDVEINVPFTAVNRPEHISMQGIHTPSLHDGVTRRPHAFKHRAVLVTWADGTKGKVQFATTLKPMDEPDRAKLEQLLAEHHRVSGQINEIIRDNRIDLPEEVERARGELLADG